MNGDESEPGDRLSALLHAMSNGSLTDGNGSEAARNLGAFMTLLIEADTQQRVTGAKHTRNEATPGAPRPDRGIFQKIGRRCEQT